MNKISLLQKIIDSSNNIVFFTGAGISTLSGLKDFRSIDGLYNESWDYPPESILSHRFFYFDMPYFYKFYKSRLNPIGYEPNIIHNYIYELEKKGKVKSVITQNIDNLHTLAGTKNVLELHGNVMRNYCLKCHKFYDGNYVFNSNIVPLCECGGFIKPDVVLYEEGLDEDILNKSIESIKECDTLIVVGTSLTVYPASSLIKYYDKNNLIIINKDETIYDNVASLVIHDDLKDVFEQLR